VNSDRIDAVYIALPNSMHADYAIRALKAGKHAMVEKPLATSLAECQAMIAAAKSTGALLMTAYCLHNEPGTLAALEAIIAGEIGEPAHFSSSFAFQSALGNHRLQSAHWGGPLQDVGVYCLNAARHVFGAEPVEVQAMASRPLNDPRFAEIDTHFAVTMRFPKGRLAQFFCSFGTEAVEMYRVLGTEGELTVDPGYRFESGISLHLRSGAEVEVTNFPTVDHFSGQIAYFSDCIAAGDQPEADGEEGMADMRVLMAIEESIRTGANVAVNSPARGRHPDAALRRNFAPTSKRLLIG
jgi:predicted dehydrogenase